MAASRTESTRRGRSGQVMLEYVLVFLVLFGVVAALALFAKAARKEAVRTAELVTSDYP